ncbi:MAG: sugar-binding protein, partial [Oscillospiraceae bacterium]
YIKNMVNVPLNATVSIDALKNVDILNVEKQEVKDLQYNDVKKVVFPLSKVPNSDEATISVIVENNGFSAKAQRNFNFSGVINDGKAPSIDGVLSDGEWDMNSFVTQNDTAKTPYLPEWKGDADCSFKIYRKWDSENFYLAAEVLDNVHYQGGVGGDLWQGDGIQFAIDPGRKNGKGSSLYHEIGIALNNDKKVIAHRWVAPLLIKQGTLINYKCSIKRLDTKTVYELSIPWSDLVDGSAPKSGDSLGFSLLVNDNDGLGRRGWLDFMGGIGSGKNTSLFEDMVLINK